MEPRVYDWYGWHHKEPGQTKSLGYGAQAYLGMDDTPVGSILLPVQDASPDYDAAAWPVNEPGQPEAWYWVISGATGEDVTDGMCEDKETAKAQVEKWLSDTYAGKVPDLSGIGKGHIQPPTNS